MNENSIKISVCLVVYNEEKVIGRCLESIKNLADEIILVHDGECLDKTLEIAKQYTDKIFIRPHTGDSSLHRVFTYKQAQGEWIFQIDADEYLDEDAAGKIKELVDKAKGTNVNGYRFKWEMWNGKKAIYIKGFQKDCLFRKDYFHYLGVTHGWAYIDGITEDSDLCLHHRPKYNNIAWGSFFKKVKRWVPTHAKFYFPEMVVYEGFNIDSEKWIQFVGRVKDHMWFYMIFEPIKMFFGQFKNGLYSRFVGWKVAFQHSLYYFILYLEVWKLKKKLK